MEKTKLKIGDRIMVSHTENYPYELLPEGAYFAHLRNFGNSYDGLSSELIVVAADQESQD